MPSGKGFFEIQQLPGVTQTLRELVEKAEVKGTEKELLAVLKEVASNLQTDPLKWGNPEYHPRKTGSTVCHGICCSLYVQYVVFELENIVLPLRVKPLLNSPWAGNGNESAGSGDL